MVLSKVFINEEMRFAKMNENEEAKMKDEITTDTNTEDSQDNTQEEKPKYLNISKYPKLLKTREDYEFIRKNFDPKLWMEDFRQLLNSSMEEKVVGTCRVVKKNKEEYAPVKMKFFKGNESLKEFYERRLDEDYVVCASIDKDTEARYYGTQPITKKTECAMVKHQVKPNSKMESLGYTQEDLVCLSLGIDPSGLELLDKLSNYEKVLDERIKKLDEEIAETDENLAEEENEKEQ